MSAGAAGAAPLADGAQGAGEEQEGDHEYEHDASAESYGLEAAEKLGVMPERMFKTLVVKLDKAELAVGVVPVASMLNMKCMAKACGAKKAAMADPAEVQRATGYILGGVSPLGQKKRMPTVIDSSAGDFETVYVSAGRRGLDIELDPDAEWVVAPADLRSRSRNSAYLGETLTGRVKATFLRGRLTWRDEAE